METVKFTEKGDVRMIAHRGVSGLEKENTLPAFLLAGQGSYYGIETDLRITKDDKFVLFHDDDLKRCFGIEKRVCECDFEWLRSLRFTGKDGAKRADLFLPTPEEYFSVCKRFDKEAVLELKAPLTDEQVGEVVQLVRSLGWFSRTTFISFEQGLLSAVRKRFSDAKLYYLAGECTQEEEAFMVEQGVHADLHYPFLTRERVEKYHALGIKINCWTVDNVQDAARLKDWGVDLITSNILE